MFVKETRWAYEKRPKHHAKVKSTPSRKKETVCTIKVWTLIFKVSPCPKLYVWLWSLMMMLIKIITSWTRKSIKNQYFGPEHVYFIFNHQNWNILLEPFLSISTKYCNECMNQWYRFTGENWIGIMHEIVTGKINDVVLLDKTGWGTL